LVLHRYARATARDYLSAWLHHLVLCASAPPGVARQTWWLGETGSFMLSPVAAPLARLAELSALYQVGLRTPLWFFPRSAWAQVATSAAEARSTWLGGPMSHGEVDDAYLQIALRALGDPGAALDPVFERLAQVVYRPLQEHLRDADGLR
jgi:exodeoxyribonuclease V gamma subunit